MNKLYTTFGPKSKDDLDLVLPHEHFVVDFGLPEAVAYTDTTVEDVLSYIEPLVEDARKEGVTAMVVCTPVGVGRRADIDLAISEALNLPVVIPTGVYREHWIPDWVRDSSETDLTRWMVDELTEGIKETGVQAGWIKLSASDDGLTQTETKILRAAASAGAETGAVIGSHTIRGDVVADQLDIIEDAGYSSERFIWIHTQRDPEFDHHLEIARRGAWIEYDSLGDDGFDENLFIDRIQTILEAGFGDQLLLSHDGGWYDPSLASQNIKPYSYLSTEFIPRLQEASIDDATVSLLTRENPFNAFAR